MTIGILRLAAVVLIRTVAVLVVAALVVSGALLTSNTGARWAVSVLGAYVPELSVGTTEGSLLGGLALGDVRYASASTDLELRRLVLRPAFAPLVEGRLVLERLEVDGGSVDVPPATGPAPLPEIPEYFAVRALRLADFAIHGVGAPIRITSAAAALDGPRLDLEDVRMRAGSVGFTGRGTLTVTAETLAGSLDVRLTWQDRAPGTPHPAVAMAADVVVAPVAQPWFATLEWNRLVWNGSPVGDLRSPTGRLVAVPGAHPVTIELAAELASVTFPDLRSLAADASVRGSAVEVGVALRALGGELTGGGRFNLAERTGRFDIVGRGLDPSRLDTRLAGRVGGRIDVTVAAEPVPRFVASGELNGEIRGDRLEAQLRGRYSERTAELERVVVRLGDGRLELAGSLTPESMDLSFAADVPRIDTWYPGVRGAMVTSGAVRGDWRDPAITARIGGRNLTLDDASTPSLDELRTTVDGSLTAHTVHLTGRSGSNVMKAEVRQGWDGEALQGSLVDSTLAVTRAGVWTLAAPAEYSIGAAAAGLERICYSGPGGGLVCAELHDERLSVSATNLPSRLAEPWLPDDLELLGTADADLELDWRDARRGSVTLRQSSLVVRTTAHSQEASGDATGGLPWRVEVVNLALDGVLEDEQFRARVLAGLADDAGRLEAELRVEPPLAHGALSGRLVTSLTDVAWLDALLDGVQDVEGSVEVDLSVHGTPAAPGVRGTMAIRSLRATLPPLGVEVTGGRLSARAENPDEVVFDGRLCTDGCVTFGGRLERPLHLGWRVEAGLGGEPLEVVDTPTLRAVVAPELELTGDRTGWRVTGTLGIDDAAAIVATVPRSAVRPAPETVVHGGPAARAPADRQPWLTPAVDVQAHLGSVRFEGLGLEAELGGTLGLARTPLGRLFVQGNTEIERGTFRIYGQELDIERGLLTFAGRPDNPSLDIRATREVEGARVGLEITGTADNPVSQIFADSQMSDSEALAQLLTGRPLADAVAEVDALERVAVNIGLYGVLSTFDRLRANIGLDELGIDRSTRALIAGERIGRNLLLCYRHGLFDDFTGLELIYGISSRFRLHTKSGSARSIDLVYSIGPADDWLPGCRRSRKVLAGQ